MFHVIINLNMKLYIRKIKEPTINIIVFLYLIDFRHPHPLG